MVSFTTRYMEQQWANQRLRVYILKMEDFERNTLPENNNKGAKDMWMTRT